jgi:hypothetical protein
LREELPENVVHGSGNRMDPLLHDAGITTFLP